MAFIACKGRGRGGASTTDRGGLSCGEGRGRAGTMIFTMVGSDDYTHVHLLFDSTTHGSALDTMFEKSL